jgi:hypothetical protein
MAAKALGAGRVAVVDMKQANLEVRHPMLLVPFACRSAGRVLVCPASICPLWCLSCCSAIFQCVCTLCSSIGTHCAVFQEHS